MPYDTHALKQALGLVLPLIRIIEDVASEQLSGFTALIKFVPLIPKIGPALRDIGDIPPEYLELSDVERADLKAFVVEQLDLTDKGAEVAIEQALAVVIDLSQLFQSLQSVRVVKI